MNNDIELLNSLSQYYFKFGIFTAEGQQEVDVNVINTDNTIINVKMKIADVMYFTEYGTITIPGQRILEKSILYISRLLDKELDDITTKILLNKIDQAGIEIKLREIALKVENYIKNYMVSIIKRNNRLGSIINEDKDSNRYIYNLNQLNKYIKCVLFKK